MAKAKAKKENRMSNKLRIETCEDCQGKPTPVAFKTDKHIGTRCEKCWEIIDFKEIIE